MNIMSEAFDLFWYEKKRNTQIKNGKTSHGVMAQDSRKHFCYFTSNRGTRSCLPHIENSGIENKLVISKYVWAN
jgi:hypothetical protein